MSIFTKLWDVIVMISGKLWDILLPAIEDLASAEGEVLMDIANKWIPQIASDTSLVTNDEKRKAAFDAILHEATTKGLDTARAHFSTSIYNAIQFAYTNYIKKS